MFELRGISRFKSPGHHIGHALGENNSEDNKDKEDNEQRREDRLEKFLRLFAVVLGEIFGEHRHEGGGHGPFAENASEKIREPESRVEGIRQISAAESPRDQRIASVSKDSRNKCCR